MTRLLYNEKVKSALAAYLRGGRLPHALLLEGPAGVGKGTFAREIAMGALCTAGPEEKPCGVCRDCVKVEKGVHPDVLDYAGEGGSRSFHVEKVRTIRQEAWVLPNEAHRKVLILQSVHEMTQQAENALLKILEEPPAHVVFVLTCENRAALLDTILSRVTVLELRPLSPEQCVAALGRLRPDADAARCEAVARRCGGLLGPALHLLDGESAEGSPDDAAVAFLETLCLGSELAALAELGRYEKDKEGLTRMLDGLAGGVRMLLRPEETARSEVVSRLRRRVSPLQLMQILAIIEEASASAAGNVNRLLLITDLCAGIRLTLSV